MIKKSDRHLSTFTVRPIRRSARRVKATSSDITPAGHNGIADKARSG
jgi:hypothetical protein